MTNEETIKSLVERIARLEAFILRGSVTWEGDSLDEILDEGLTEVIVDTIRTKAYVSISAEIKT